MAKMATTSPAVHKTQPPFAATKKPAAQPAPEPEPEVEEQPEEVEQVEDVADEGGEQEQEVEDVPAEASDVDDDLFPDKASLDEASNIWDEGAALADRGRPVGDFVGTILSAQLGRSTSSDRLQIAYEIELNTGEFAGEKLRKYDGLGSPQQAQITRQQLERLGVAVAGISMKQLPAVLLSLVGRQVKVKCKQNQQYHNIYFQGLVPTQQIGGSTGRPAATTAAAPARKGNAPTPRPKF